jgi:NAD(P)-dependent dehydrogenase (short-subunit alcohol dehydrogenase family)
MVFGAAGGIGSALVRNLAARDDVTMIYAGSRYVHHSGQNPKIRPFTFDLFDEASIAVACATVGAEGPVDRVIVATGSLTRADGAWPEKTWRALSAEGMAELFAINAIGPALIAKHALPLLRKPGRSVFAALSARVGSIGDNRLGGWHSYRASKAALNMLVRNFALELTRRNPEAIAVTLHPGTVDTGLSEPFQRGVMAGKLFTPDFAAEQLLSVIEALTPTGSGKLYAWDGSEIPF